MINYVKGDATLPQGEGVKVIAHCVNDVGKWGSGFVLALDERFGQKPKLAYQQWSRSGNAILGNVLFTQVGETWIANIVGQHQTVWENPKPIRYRALRRGLETTAEFCRQLAANNATSVSLGMPRLGAGLAKGSWTKIESIIEETFSLNEFCNIPVTVYDLAV